MLFMNLLVKNVMTYLPASMGRSVHLMLASVQIEPLVGRDSISAEGADVNV